MRDYENLSEEQLVFLLRILVFILVILVASTIGFAIGLLICTYIGG